MNGRKLDLLAEFEAEVGAIIQHRTEELSPGDLCEVIQQAVTVLVDGQKSPGVSLSSSNWRPRATNFASLREPGTARLKSASRPRWQRSPSCRKLALSGIGPAPN